MLQEYRDHRTSCCSNSRSVFYLSRVFRCRALLQYKGSSILRVYNFFPSRVDIYDILEFDSMSRVKIDETTNPASLKVERQRGANQPQPTLANRGRLFSAKCDHGILFTAYSFHDLHPFFICYFALKPGDVFSALLFVIRG